MLTKSLTDTQHSSGQLIYPAPLAVLTELFPAETPIPASVLIQDLPQPWA